MRSPRRPSENREAIDRCFHTLYVELGPVVGRAAIDIIVETLGGDLVHIPSRATLERDARRRAIRARLDKGEPRREVAASLGITLSHLARILSRGDG